MNHIIKNSIVAVIAALIVGVAVYTTPVKKDKTIQGVIYSIGSYEQTKPIELTLQGRYKRGIFSRNKFSGKIGIEGYDLTLEKSTMSTINFKNGRGNLVYSIWNLATETTQDYFLGSIFVNDSFSQFTILVNAQVKDINSNSDWTWSESNGIVITAAATNGKEALEIAEKLTRKSGLQLK
ncbi:MAG: hypothetical protein RSB96_01795 [Oscillospiraceae bacterium]